MSFDPNSKIKSEEILCRAFHYDQWDHSENRVTSAVFNSSSPVSVDRDGEREEQKIISDFRVRENYEKSGIVKNLAQFYFEINCKINPAPIDQNIYHALVNRQDGEGTNRSIARKLAKNAKLIIMADSK